MERWLDLAGSLLIHCFCARRRAFRPPRRSRATARAHPRGRDRAHREPRAARGATGPQDISLSGGRRRREGLPGGARRPRPRRPPAPAVTTS